MKKKSKSKLTVFAVALAALTLALSACSNTSSGEAPASDALVYGSGDYTSINPALYEHGEINSLIFAGLTAHNEKNEVVPGLAESWAWDEASLTYDFRLREGLTFHDGEPLTAEDVVFTLETIMDEGNGSEIISNYEEIESVTAEGDLDVAIKLSAPSVAMPDYLAIGILPKHLLEGENVAESAYNQNPVGAGPYKLAEWDMGQSITMEKFDGFYLGAPKIEKIIFKIVEADDQRALQLKTGELDLAQVTPKDAEEFKDDEAFKVYDMDTADYRGIMYNFNNPFWRGNPGLPAALSYAIDRDAVVSSVLLGQGQPAWSPLQKGAYVNEGIEKYDYDADKAKAAIEALGWTVGEDGYYAKGGEQLGFEISVRPSDQVRVDMANIAAQNLQDVGVNAVVAINEKTDWENQSTFLIGWGSPFDPDDHTYKVFGTAKGANYSSYSNQDVDRILTEARSTEDTDRRRELYNEFQEAFVKDPAYTFIAYIDAIYVAGAGLSGITEDTSLGHHGVGIFWNVYEWELN
ncbi:MAG: ABC transporter substrate-binding protein [Clostridiales Family XIII bacterium]|jgi:peptide/nickel transport system substrate-binding protein|nr:ABC transporter substrate-binding protein [Clostridiales Family XIII bacterium]